MSLSLTGFVTTSNPASVSASAMMTACFSRLSVVPYAKTIFVPSLPASSRIWRAASGSPSGGTW